MSPTSNDNGWGCYPEESTPGDASAGHEYSDIRHLHFELGSRSDQIDSCRGSQSFDLVYDLPKNTAPREIVKVDLPWLRERLPSTKARRYVFAYWDRSYRFPVSVSD
jgi:hypothetical protein